MAIDVLTRAKEWVGRNWKQLSVIGMTMIALSGCMEEKLPNNVTPDGTPDQTKTIKDSTVIPTSQRFVEEGGKSGEPSDRERILLEAGYNMHTD